MSSGNEIAIVGMSGRFPGAASVDALWEVLRDGQEPLRATEQDTASPALSDQVSHMVRANSTLPDIDLFDAAFFGFNPREAEMTDPQHRIFLECAWEALENAGIKVGDRARPIGVFAGTGMSSYVFGQIEHDAQILEAFPSIIATDKDFVSTRTSFKLNLTGPSLTVQCACSTAMVAVHLACQSLIAGECDAAIAGGVAAAVPQHDTYKYLPGAMLAPDGRCRPFDAAGRGTVFADGAAVITLMRLEDALSGGYPVRAVILGSAVNNDGSQKPGYTAPTVDGQVEVVTQALAVAGVAADDIAFIEAHGTGTVLGDAIEIGALTKVMRRATEAVGLCTLGSIKSNIGHTLAAAGVAGIIKAVLTLEHEAIPACANFETPNPDLDFATSPFTVNTTLKPWARSATAIRRAGVSSFGVGGTNAHLILEEAPQPASGPSRRAWHVLPLSARSDAVLPAVADRLRSHLERPKGAPFADTVYTAQVGRRAFEHRRIVIAADAAGAAAALGGGDGPRSVSRKLPQNPAKIAFMFTGQGSQYPGMGVELYRDEPVFAAAVDRCLSLVAPSIANDLRDLVFAPGTRSAEDATRLQRTETAQVALFVMHYALAELLEAWGVRPDLMIGHSIGDYAAACRADVLSLPEALRLVALRGRLMSEMQPGTMLSVAAAAEDLPPLPYGVSIAAANAPKLVVLAGPTEALAAYGAKLAEAGIGARRLQTSHAFHSAMMEPMLPEFRTIAASISFEAPRIPLVSSLTGELATAAEVMDPDFWANQIREPVRFARGCDTLVDLGATLVLEVGPGRSLSALAQQCGLQARGLDIVTLLPDAQDPALGVAAALGRLWLAGVDVDWAALHAGETRCRVALPTYPFDRQSYWIDPTLRMSTRKETADKDLDPRRWFYAPAWQQLGPVSNASTGSPQRVLVVGGPEPLSAATAALLRGRGHDVTMLADTAPASLDRLVENWTDASDTPDRIVHLSSLVVDEDHGRDAAEDVSFWNDQERDTLGLLRLLQTIASVADGKPLAVHIVSTGLYDLTGSDPLVPGNVPLVTFARVAAQEVAGVTCRVLDIDPVGAHSDVADLAVRIEARFAASGAEETVVALRRRKAWRLDYARIDADAAFTAERPVRERGVTLVTGGLGKVGLVFARYLASTARSRLVLVGRSAMPDPETWDAVLASSATHPDLRERIEAVRSLEALGAEVLVLSADVADEAEMAGVIAAADRRFGGIDGLVHCAGVTNVGRVLLDTGRLEFEQNLRSKVFGLMVLDRLLADRTLDFGIVVSSLSAVLGGLGHMAYAAANATADAIVLKRNQMGRGLWTSVDWDSWKFEQGRIDKVQAILNMLDYSMDEAEGTRAIDLLFSLPQPEQVVISTGNLALRVRLWIEQHAVIRSGEAKGGQHKRPDVETPFAEPQGPIEQRLALIWMEALGLDRVGRDDDFFEIGGHSLLAVQILSKTRDAFGVDFPLDRAMDAARLSSAAAVVASLLDGSANPTVRLEAAE